MKQVYAFSAETQLLMVVDEGDMAGPGARTLRGKGVPFDQVAGITRRADGVAVVRFTAAVDVPDAYIPAKLEPLLAKHLALPPSAALPAN
jgi:hypothetical protein